ncbi:MAG: manganese efflux pump MntP family protein [Clostridiales bacterium]|nr:manganese efflux pump MntP family protein [Clostridiales bacterium]
MHWSFMFLVNSILLGIGLSMDAFSVSMANGLNEPQMRRRKAIEIAGVFAGFQALMPLAGWFCVHTAARYFTAFQPFIPWIALALLAFIGGKMLIDGLRNQTESESTATLGPAALIVQGIATSIDALSVGFTIADYNGQMALAAALIIAAVTFVICMAGVSIGKKFGTRLSNKAQILGGVILIAIGLEIFLSGVVFG